MLRLDRIKDKRKLTDDIFYALCAESCQERCHEEVAEEGGVLELADGASKCQIHL